MLFHHKYEVPALTIQRYFRGARVRLAYRRERAAIVIQKYYRGWHVRRYGRQEAAAIVIQKYFRGWKVRSFSREDHAAIIIQTNYRAWRAREFYSLLRTVVTIQKYYRGWRVGLGVYVCVRVCTLCWNVCALVTCAIHPLCVCACVCTGVWICVGGGAGAGEGRFQCSRQYLTLFIEELTHHYQLIQGLSLPCLLITSPQAHCVYYIFVILEGTTTFCVSDVT